MPLATLARHEQLRARLARSFTFCARRSDAGFPRNSNKLATFAPLICRIATFRPSRSVLAWRRSRDVACRTVVAGASLVLRSLSRGSLAIRKTCHEQQRRAPGIAAHDFENGPQPAREDRRLATRLRLEVAAGRLTVTTSATAGARADGAAVEAALARHVTEDGEQRAGNTQRAAEDGRGMGADHAPAMCVSADCLLSGRMRRSTTSMRTSG